MTGASWCPVGSVDFGRLAEARLQAHYAAQWLARAARAFIPAKPDDSHTSLGWDEGLDGFVTHPLNDGAHLGLKISDLTLALVSAKGNERAQAIELNGRTDKEARAWLGEQLAAKGHDAGALDAKPPYEIPAHAIAKGGKFDAAALADALRELAAWFANANLSLGRVRQEYAAKHEVSPVRCWPHHFDIAALISLDPGGGERARSVNAGLSPGDGSYNEPYFYVSPWPYPEAAKRPRLPKLGLWHTKGFTAAVAPASRIVAAKDRQQETEAFLAEAVEGSIKALG